MNISEIAALAGVSKAAVSRYFNNGYISEAKREQIRKVVEQTGYQPSAQAQTLRTRKTRTIGVIIPKINSDSISRVVAGISSVLEETGYQLLLGNTYNSVERELDYLHLFSDKRVDGVIFIATVLTKKHQELMKELNVPIVVVGQKIAGYNCVYHDDKNAIREMTERIIEKGRTNIGYLAASNEEEAAGNQRNIGFVEAMEKHGLVYTGHTVVAGFELEKGYERMEDMLKANPGLDAGIGATDSLAIGAMRMLTRFGKKVPEEICITGLGDSQMAAVTSPTISTVHFFYKTSGMEAAKILMEALEGKSVIRQVCMGYEIREQEST